MHRDGVEINSTQVKRLIAEQFPRFEGEEIVGLTTAGTVNAIFRIGAFHAARFPLRMMASAECTRLLQAEARAGVEFHQCCPFPSPKPIGLGRAGAGYPVPWLLQTWLQGEVATPAGLSGSSVFALDLVRLITVLREANLNGRSFDGRGRGGHLPDHDAWMEECFSRSEDLLDVARLRNMWASFRKLPSLKREVMSHRDLIPANLLVDGERLVGVLDTGGFGPADPSLDLVAGWHLLDRDRRAVFRHALQADDLEWRRGAAWAFQQAMGLVWYYKDTNPVMSELGRSTLSRLIEADME